MSDTKATCNIREMVWTHTYVQCLHFCRICSFSVYLHNCIKVILVLTSRVSVGSIDTSNLPGLIVCERLYNSKLVLLHMCVCECTHMPSLSPRPAVGAGSEHTRLTHCRLQCETGQVGWWQCAAPLLPHLSAMAADRMQFPARGRPGGWNGEGAGGM